MFCASFWIVSKSTPKTRRRRLWFTEFQERHQLTTNLCRLKHAGGRNRTDMMLPSGDFESPASTNFTTPAHLAGMSKPQGFRPTHLISKSTVYHSMGQTRTSAAHKYEGNIISEISFCQVRKSWSNRKPVTGQTRTSAAHNMCQFSIC